MFFKSLKTLIKSLFVIFVLTVLYIVYGYVVDEHEFKNETMNEMVTKYGYPFEAHSVQTDDGYILELHRIPYGINSKTNVTRPAVLLMHGLTMNSESWVLIGPKESVAYFLADQGYDVWMGNARGNRYSRKHAYLDPDKDAKAFWNFSWNEIGFYDLPAKIDYIATKTGQERIFYVGHSQGCVSFMVMMSERPQYNKKIRLMMAFAPVVYLNDIKSWVFTIPAFFQGIAEFLSNTYLYEITQQSETRAKLSNFFCNHPIGKYVCLYALSKSGGLNAPQLKMGQIGLMLAHFPDSSALKQLTHYTQVLRTDEFKKYDHGPETNLKVYGQKVPPFYKLENVLANVSLYFGKNDMVTSDKDHKHLVASLPNVVKNTIVPDEQFSHINFLWSKDIFKLLMIDVVKLMKNY